MWIRDTPVVETTQFNSLNFTPEERERGRMVDCPGYRLSGVAASLLFILLTVKHPDDFRVIGPALPILAKVGEDALLTCQLLPKRTMAHMEVRWYRSDPDMPVIMYRDGTEVVGLQMDGYRGRAEWMEGSTDEGSVALKIHQVQPGDDGQYWCRFQEGDYWREASVLLQVAGSSPNIHLEGPGEGEFRFLCMAQGWFPEPEVYWEGTWGEKSLSFSENHMLGEDGLFSVEDTLVVKNDTSDTISCFIYNQGLREAKKATISLPEKLQSELASSRVIGPSQPMLVQVGENIELTCHLSPQADAQSMEVRWVRSHYYPAVHVYVGGAHLAEDQMTEYRGRTEVMSDAIHEGKLTLRIHGARPSDDGRYRCLFGKDGVYQEAHVDVQVIALGSSPRITREVLEDGGMQLKCASDGWFPRPLVQWRDRNGRTIPSFSEAFHQGSQGLFQVETLLLVTNSSMMNVTCSISLPQGEEKTARFPLSDSKIALLWMTLPVLVLPLAMAVDLIKVKRGTNNQNHYSNQEGVKNDKSLTGASL
ncbi:butyrophilin 2 [Sigmodon hispidus]